MKKTPLYCTVLGILIGLTIVAGGLSAVIVQYRECYDAGVNPISCATYVRTYPLTTYDK